MTPPPRGSRSGEQELSAVDLELPAALETLHEAVVVLQSFDLSRLSEVDARAFDAWRAELRRAGGTLRRAFEARGENVPVTPAGRGHVARFNVARMQHHVADLGRDLDRELSRIGAVRRAAQVESYRLLGLYFRLREVLQFLRWCDEQRGAEPQTVEAAGSVDGTGAIGIIPPAPPVPPDPTPAEIFPAVLAVTSPAAKLEPPPTLTLPVRSLPYPSLPAPAQAAVAGPPPEETPPPPPPIRIRDYVDRPDDAGGVLRAGPITAWHAYARRPAFGAVPPSLDVTTVLPIRDGVAFALADGSETSVGARAGASLVATVFTKLLATYYSPMIDPRGTLAYTADWTLQHLDQLVRALAAQGDGSEALALVGGGLPLPNVRRILQNTTQPDPALRHAAPALAVSLLGGLLRRNPERNVYELFVLRVGGGSVERKRRGSPAEPILPGTRDRTAAFHAGPAGRETVAAAAVTGPVEVAPGEAILVASSSMSHGHEELVWNLLARVDPLIDRHWDGADDRGVSLLAKVTAMAVTLDAFEAERAEERLRGEDLTERGRATLVRELAAERERRRLLDDDVSMILVSLDARAEVGSPPRGAERRAAAPRAAVEAVPAPRVDASARQKLDFAAILKILNKPL